MLGDGAPAMSRPGSEGCNPASRVGADDQRYAVRGGAHCALPARRRMDRGQPPALDGRSPRVGRALCAQLRDQLPVAPVDDLSLDRASTRTIETTGYQLVDQVWATDSGREYEKRLSWHDRR